MRIAMVLSNPCSPDPRVEKEAAALSTAGHEVIVVAWDRAGGLPEAEKKDGFSVVRTGPRARYGGGLSSIGRFRRFWRTTPTPSWSGFALCGYSRALASYSTCMRCIA
jgi:hypothetical protein